MFTGSVDTRKQLFNKVEETQNLIKENEISLLNYLQRSMT